MQSTDSESFVNEAFQLLGVGQLDRATLICDKVLQQDPLHWGALHCRGIIHFQRGALDQAIIAFTQALEIRSDSVLFSNLGLALSKINHGAEALACYSASISLNPYNAEAFYNQGNTFHHLERFEEALHSHDQAIGLNPAHAQALCNRGMALRALKRLVEALNSIDRAIGINPNNAAILNNRGTLLIELNRPQEALVTFDQALSIDPDFTAALYNKGNTLLALGMPESAGHYLTQAVAGAPGDPDAHFNLALFHLVTGNYEAGWREYEWRWKQSSYKPLHHFEQPRWTGHQDLNGKTILLHTEQGAGDTLQFIRYIPMVKALGAHIVLEVQVPIKPLLESLNHVDVLLSQGETLPPFDYHCMLMSLPYAFNTTLSTIPPAEPPQLAPTTKISSWSEKLRLTPTPRIGLAWSGNPTHKNDHNRSIPLAYLIKRLAPEFRYISLQQELRPADKAVLQSAHNVLSVEDQLHDFSDTAALIANLDLVISVDTSIAHLAGAMEKPAWILLPYAPDWRWLVTGEYSPWYPLARLFRQPTFMDWEDPIARINLELREKFDHCIS